MTPQEFIAKWKKVRLSERSAAQQHFLDLCELLGQPKPAAEDPEGAWYTFERGAHKQTGGEGWADVWLKGHFAWEYKRKHRDLAAAYQQLLLYREDLENPPLLVVCDMDRFEVHTNFTGTAKQVYAFDLDGLADPAHLDVLRKLFTNPESLKPGQTREGITRAAAERFAQLADGMRDRGLPALRAAHFLMKLMFCMFAEDVDLLPGKLFKKLLDNTQREPKKLGSRLQNLFAAMAHGGDFGVDPIPHFNGGLFADADVVDLTGPEVEELARVDDYDWSNVEPSIFGTLFERTLDPDKRSQIGAHYTSKDDIVTLLEPVLMAPLRREWADVRARCEKLWTKVRESARQQAGGRRGKPSKFRQQYDQLLLDFVQRLAHVTVLDPACGSGNFLYVAINLLLDLEKEVIAYAANHDTSVTPHVNPSQLAGLEINPYAQQLAQVVIWIGYLQWKHQNGFAPPRDPVLQPIDNIRRQDAILDLSDPDNPQEPEWPAADFIVGNPPFLGGKKMRAGLGDDYMDRLFATWRERVPAEADLRCYWFEKARQQIQEGRTKQAGLLATQGIRGGANRAVLERIKITGDIFFAVSDRDWILDGANVHVSMVGFDGAEEQGRTLDSKAVAQINSNLSAHADVTRAHRLAGNLCLAFMGDTKGGAFDLPERAALALVQVPNPHGLPNSDVLVPWVNGRDVTARSRGMWIIDLGIGMSEADAAQYEAPFEYLRRCVEPERKKNARDSYRRLWWQHVEPRPGMRSALAKLPRFLVTPTVAKHRLFLWMQAPTLPDHQVIVFGCAEDYLFGVLHSRAHEVWARAQGTQVRERESGFRYTPTSCFETFALPKAT